MILGCIAFTGDSIPGRLRLPSPRRSKVLLSRDWMPSTCKKLRKGMVLTVTFHNIDRSMSLEVTWHESFLSRSPDQISHLPKHFILNAGKRTKLKRAYQSEFQDIPVGRRIRFVKFCHTPSVVDQQGCFIHMKRTSSPRLMHRRSFWRNICSRDLIY